MNNCASLKSWIIKAVHLDGVSDVSVVVLPRGGGFGGGTFGLECSTGGLSPSANYSGWF